MSRTLKELFDTELSHVVFNQHLATELYKFQVGFVNKNEEHMAFFGGNLLGVQVVRFTERDFNFFFDEILDIDPIAIRALLVDVEAIEMDRKVTSDIFNLTCMYLIHRFLTTPMLDERKRERAAMDVALIFNYRCITSLIFGRFIYPADPRSAQAVYANLSYKHLIKKLGSWNALMAYRANDLISKEGLHRNSLIAYIDDPKILYAISDSHGRISDIVKNIYRELMKVTNEGDKVYTTSSTMLDVDGVEIIKDRTHGMESYTNYLISVIPDRNSFIKTELTGIVVKLMATMQPKAFNKVLEWISENYSKPEHPELEEMIRLTMIHSFNYLIEHGHVLKNTKDLAGLLSKLRGVYVSSRSNDPDLIKLREVGARIIGTSIGKTNEQSVAAIRTGLFLYLCLRAYTKHHYSG